MLLTIEYKLILGLAAPSLVTKLLYFKDTSKLRAALFSVMARVKCQLSALLFKGTCKSKILNLRNIGLFKWSALLIKILGFPSFGKRKIPATKSKQIKLYIKYFNHFQTDKLWYQLNKEKQTLKKGIDRIL